MQTKESFFKRPGVQTLLASVLCAVLGIIIGFIILWFMNSEHAAEGIVWWKGRQPICKIKRTDFGFSWPYKKEDTDIYDEHYW